MKNLVISDLHGIDFRPIYELQIVLFGNHEAMYVNRQNRNNLDYTSKNKYQDEVENLIETYINEIDFAYQGPKYLYSHQGITKTFMNTINCKTIDELNNKFHNKDYSILDCKDGIRDWWNNKMFDSNVNQFEYLCKDKWCDNQIVGHYSKYGMCFKDSILAIEDLKHANIMTIYE